MGPIFSYLKRFARNCSGSFSTIAAIMVPVLLVGAAGVVDLTNFQRQKSALQEAADNAALSSVKEAILQGWNEDAARQIAAAYVAANLDDGELGTRTYRTASSIDKLTRSVTVEIDMDHYPYFYARLFPTPQISVSATAKSASTSKVCILGLMPPQKFAKSSVHLDHNSKLEAKDCSVISNSTDKFGLRVDFGSALTAKFICSAGGILKLWGTTIFPSAVTNCPQLDDPLAAREQPSIGACDYTNKVVNTNGMLSPGVYCGGLTVTDSAQVTLSEGLYIIKDGPLLVQDKSVFKGQNVSFFFTGAGSIFEMGPDTEISLSAMKTGVMAGLLMSEDRTTPYSFDFNPLSYKLRAPDVRLHSISSNNARNFNGTIYLPNSILLIDAKAPVADTSAYTAIVIGRLWLREGPTLVLNADYSATDVPVPEGLGGGKITLER